MQLGHFVTALAGSFAVMYYFWVRVRYKKEDGKFLVDFEQIESGMGILLICLSGSALIFAFFEDWSYLTCGLFFLILSGTIELILSKRRKLWQRFTH